jgi:TIR domain
MTKLWLTYAWKDNETEQVDFVAQELRKAGLEVMVDRVALIAGRRLWPQIAAQIEKPENSDAWAIYVTENSLRSEPCQEELAIALDRALRSRGDAYPLIGIFPAPIDSTIVPPAIRTRLYVDLTDSNWVERVRSSAQNELPSIEPQEIESFVSRVGRFGDGWYIEIHPRAGRWLPTFVIVQPDEIDQLTGQVVGPSNFVTGTGTIHTNDLFRNSDNRRCGWQINSALTAQESLYQFWRQLPSEIKFGPDQNALFIVRP